MYNLNKYKPKEIQDLRIKNYYLLFLEDLCNMFTWTLPAPELNPKWIEQYLHETGSIGVKKEKDGYKVAPAPSRAGKLDMYGDGLEVVGTYVGNSFKGTIFEDCSICYNNLMRTKDFDMTLFSNLLANIDKSINANVNWSILAPIMAVKDDKIKKSLDNVLNNILEGELKTVVSQDLLDGLKNITTDNKGIYTIDVTQPDRIKNVQYLSELYDVLMRRFYNKYGLNIQNSSKHAQASVDEVHGMDSVSWVYALSMLNERKKFCEDMSRITGDTWGVEFSPVWYAEYNRYLKETKKPDIEIAKAKAERDGLILDNEMKEKALTEPGPEEQPDENVENSVESVETEPEEQEVESND